jgi:NAD(P)-dependent dehydrogenase (short-subunit alcohol dehydrogenase family)
LAVAKAFLARGGGLVVTGTSQSRLDAARLELGTDQVHLARLDVTDLAAVREFATVVVNRFGWIDLLHFNAGFAALEAVPEVTEASFDRTFDVNTKGAFFTVQALAPLVRDGGAIVLTTSIANVTGTPGMSVYSGAKAAVRAFTKAFAAELLPRGIRVNAVSPGFIDTPTMGVASFTEAQKAEFRELGDDTTPMRRHGTAEEVARAVLFLELDATFTTGVELPVDGGLAQGLEVPAA